MARHRQSADLAAVEILRPAAPINPLDGLGTPCSRRTVQGAYLLRTSRSSLRCRAVDTTALFEAEAIAPITCRKQLLTLRVGPRRRYGFFSGPACLFYMFVVGLARLPRAGSGTEPTDAASLREWVIGRSPACLSFASDRQPAVQTRPMFALKEGTLHRPEVRAQL